jgi:AraC-like DNA-binding protein
MCADERRWRCMRFVKHFKLSKNTATFAKKIVHLRQRACPPRPLQRNRALAHIFSQQLSSLTNQIVLEQQNAEPPLVQRAREYIEKHKTEPLSLAAVAKAAGASAFHFCKVFRKSTGLKFTDYVARVRLEHAKTQLLNPNRRISEVAYDVGFQSLTQFNRMFKRVFGQAPTEFREHLHAKHPRKVSLSPR